ncbi:MAG: hypothetical protein NTZ74_12945 [Chloroflexi bacterium]|nr:hypothetical protein [Chloroflexota bacterium]
MRENLMSGSMWQGMETRYGVGNEALSEETERNELPNLNPGAIP